MENTADLQKEINLLREQLAQEKSINAALKEKIEQLLNQRFKPSSEKISTDQLGLFNEAEELLVEEESENSKATTVKTHERKARPRISIPEHYPREEIVHNIFEADKI